MAKISSGLEDFDKFLNGGYAEGEITSIFGPAASGKTTLAMLATINLVKNNKKIIFIDTENGFSIERLKQICPDYNKIINNIIFIKPTNFKMQQKVICNMQKINSEIGLIVVDTLTCLYRAELGKNNDNYELNKKLSLSAMYLSKIARNNKIPIIVTSQVYDNPEKKITEISGGNVLNKISNLVIELKKTNHSRVAIIKEDNKNKKFYFKIFDKGIKKVKDSEI